MDSPNNLPRSASPRKNSRTNRTTGYVKNGVASCAVPMQKQEQLHGKQNQQCSGLDQLYRQQGHPNRCGPDRAVIHIAVFPGNSVAAVVFCRTGNTIKDRMRASGIVVCCERISCMEALLKGIPFYKMGCKLRQNCSCKQEYRPQPIEIYQIGIL